MCPTNSDFTSISAILGRPGRSVRAGPIRLPLKENAWKCMKIHENIWKWNSDVPIRQIRSRAFWPFRPIYTQGSITNVTKPHKFGTLTRPGTLLGQAANWFILGEKIHRYLIACPHSFTRPLNFKSSKQVAFDFFVRSCDTSTIAAIFAHYKEGKAITFSHIYFFLVFQTGVD